MMKKKISSAAFAFVFMSIFPALVFAGGPFGPPQPISRKDGGLHTAIGYWHREDRFKNGGNYTLKQDQVYSQAGYGSGDLWEVYGRIGISDLKIKDVFSPTPGSAGFSNNDFEDGWWNFFGTLGGKVFYPLGRMAGIGAFAQGTWFFSDFSDTVPVASGGAPFTADLKVKELWDVNIGAALQVLVNDYARLYAGPYLYYSEARVSTCADVPGLRFTGDSTIRNKSWAGVFAGFDAPLGKGFRAGLEAQYSERFSIGAAVTYTY